MYDYFVFVWRAGAGTVDILHGRASTLWAGDGNRSSTMVLYRGVAIEGDWTPDNLRHFGVGWVRRRRSECG